MEYYSDIEYKIYTSSEPTIIDIYQPDSLECDN